jgi:hypothetical protein
MGQENSKSNNKDIYIPTGKLYDLSYVIDKPLQKVEEINGQQDLSYILEPYDRVGLIMQLVYYKLKNNGYSLKPLNIESSYSSINEILNDIGKKGLPILNNKINDIKLISNCYHVELNTVYHFLNQSEILLCLIIIDEEFFKVVLNIDKVIIATDVILIVGYDLETIFIKTKWSNEILKIENRFIKNIKEIWNIEIYPFY